ncbi:reverse transcriptase domain-containing protein [Enterobacter asburiae]|uniref:reverse transcriptase domain-containing protein n=1 Tax=Enterobacter asburiae TaxID=61645 RepID=UPI003F580129
MAIPAPLRGGRRQLSHPPRKGISRGAALSPLLAAFHLYDLDCHFAKNTRVRYARYMDDFLILAPTRWSLRRAVRDLKHFMENYGFTLHPDKTQLRKTERGFDWMGLWFKKHGMHSIAPRAVSKHRLQCRRLYEHIRYLNKDLQAARMALYRRRWVRALVPDSGPGLLDGRVSILHLSGRCLSCLADVKRPTIVLLRF